MTPARYRVHRAAGPEITAEDVERLKTFRPLPGLLPLAVRSALRQIGNEYRWERHRAQGAAK